MTVTASSYARSENDLYQTEPWVTEALLRHFPVRGMQVWEPAAGNHLMVDVLMTQASSVFSSDIKTYDREHDWEVDFLTNEDGAFTLDWEAIITNPPYGKGNRTAVKFIELALARSTGMVAMLLTAKFDFGNTRTHLFRDNPRFAAKIALLDRISWTLDGVTGTEDHAWYVWTEKPRLPRLPVTLYAGKAT
jgi:hypothetical protein